MIWILINNRPHFLHYIENNQVKTVTLFVYSPVSTWRTEYYI